MSTAKSTDGPDLPDSPEALEAAIVARRARLAGTLDELAERVRPANLAEDAKAEARTRALAVKDEAVTRARAASDQAVTRARAAVTDERGELLYERVAAVGAAVVALVVGWVAVRRRRRW